MDEFGAWRDEKAARPAASQNPWAPPPQAPWLAMPGRWLRRPGTPLGWMLILVALAAASLAMAPQRFGIEAPGVKTPNVHAMPNPDDDGDGWGDDSGDGWVVPPPRREFAI